LRVDRVTFGNRTAQENGALRHTRP
jgi:hypothetical protein